MRNECFLRWPFVSKIEINEGGKSADNWPSRKKLIGAKMREEGSKRLIKRARVRLKIVANGFLVGLCIR